MLVLAGNKNRSRANRGQVLDQQLESRDLTAEPTSYRKLEYREPVARTSNEGEARSRCDLVEER